MDNKLLAFILFLLLRKNQDNELGGLSSLGNFISGIEIEPRYTLEKIKILKKVGVYFPEDYIPLINKSILFTERLIKVNELVDFMQNDEYQYINESIPVDNNKDRLNKIVNTIQKEVPSPEVTSLGTVMDLIINMDNYKKMFSILSSVMNNQDGLKDPTQLISMVAPILGGDNQKNSDKLKEMNKMMEIMKILNTPKQESPKENKKIEIIEKPSKE